MWFQAKRTFRTMVVRVAVLSFALGPGPYFRGLLSTPPFRLRRTWG